MMADDSHEISYLIFLKIRKSVTKFVVCCSHDWRFKDYFENSDGADHLVSYKASQSDSTPVFIPMMAILCW